MVAHRFDGAFGELVRGEVDVGACVVPGGHRDGVANKELGRRAVGKPTDGIRVPRGLPGDLLGDRGRDLVVGEEVSVDVAV